MTVRAITWCITAIWAAQDRVWTRVRDGDDVGSNTLETVVIAAGLLGLALGLVVVIKSAVTHYSSSIN